MSNPKITVSSKPLISLLKALAGPPHHIQEIIHTRGLPGGENEIDVLIEEVNIEIDRINGEILKQNKNDEDNNQS